MNASKAGAVSALLGALLFGCEDRNPAAGSELATGPNAGTLPATAAGSQNSLMRWDLISVDFVTLTASAGGTASAFAKLKERIASFFKRQSDSEKSSETGGSVAAANRTRR